MTHVKNWRGNSSISIWVIRISIREPNHQQYFSTRIISLWLASWNLTCVFRTASIIPAFYSLKPLQHYNSALLVWSRWSQRTWQLSHFRESESSEDTPTWYVLKGCWIPLQLGLCSPYLLDSTHMNISSFISDHSFVPMNTTWVGAAYIEIALMLLIWDLLAGGVQQNIVCGVGTSAVRLSFIRSSNEAGCQQC
jgi:hypothetical protein